MTMTQPPLSGRDADLAERLRQAAASGRTHAVITLLESGAPFIVDSVSLQKIISYLIFIEVLQIYILYISLRKTEHRPHFQAWSSD